MNTLLKNWNIVRVIRLVLGIFVVVQAFSLQSVLIGIGGSILLLSALLNVGCPGSSCAVDPTKFKKPLNQKITDVSYEEVDVTK